MHTIQSLKQEIDEIKSRNARVEAEKAWETSTIRKIVIFVFTYIVIVIFFFVVDLPSPFRNAVVPAAAFIISTLTITVFKKWWINKIYKA